MLWILKVLTADAFYCFCMFVNKHVAYPNCAYLKKWRVLLPEFFVILFFHMQTNILQDFLSALVYCKEKWKLHLNAFLHMSIQKSFRFCVLIVVLYFLGDALTFMMPDITFFSIKVRKSLGLDSKNIKANIWWETPTMRKIFWF